MRAPRRVERPRRLAQDLLDGAPIRGAAPPTPACSRERSRTFSISAVRRCASSTVARPRSLRSARETSSLSASADPAVMIAVSGVRRSCEIVCSSAVLSSSLRRRARVSTTSDCRRSRSSAAAEQGLERRDDPLAEPRPGRRRARARRRAACRSARVLRQLVRESVLVAVAAGSKRDRGRVQPEGRREPRPRLPGARRARSRRRAACARARPPGLPRGVAAPPRSPASAPPRPPRSRPPRRRGTRSAPPSARFARS